MKPGLLTLCTMLFLIICPVSLLAQNVGVGTNTPQARLDVNGDFKLQSGVIVNTISADSNFSPGTDNVLPTQKAIKRFVQKGNWLAPVDSSFRFVSSVPVGGTLSPKKVFVEGYYAYVTSNEGRLAIFDIRDPRNIIAKDFITTNLSGHPECFVQGNYAYLTSPFNDRLCIFDISDPDNIIAKGFTSTNLDDPRDVYVRGNYAYVVSSINNSISIFDISNPDNIVAKSTTNANLAAPYALYVQGNFAYVLGTTRLSIFDISNPDIIVAKSFTTANISSGADLEVQGNYAYVASMGTHRFCIFDISDPNNILTKSTIVAGSNPYCLKIKGNYAFVGSLNNRVYVYRITDPDNIVPAGSTNQNLNGPVSVDKQGQYVYVVSEIAKSLIAYTYTGSGPIVYDGTGNVSLLPDVWEANGALDIFRQYGNVGIGVSNPTSKLDISGNANITGNSFVSGRIGIGTTTPVNKLDVEGSAVIGATYSSTSTAPVNGLLIEGNVGIGVNDPANKLSISGGITVDRALANIGTIANTVKFGAENSGEGIGSKKSAGGNQNGLDFYTNYANRMSITHGGMVGIGFTNPTVPLEVSTAVVNVGNCGIL